MEKALLLVRGSLAFDRLCRADDWYPVPLTSMGGMEPGIRLDPENDVADPQTPAASVEQPEGKFGG